MFGIDSRYPQRKANKPITIARSSLGGSVIITLLKHHILTNGKVFINSDSIVKRSWTQISVSLLTTLRKRPNCSKESLLIWTMGLSKYLPGKLMVRMKTGGTCKERPLCSNLNAHAFQRKTNYRRGAHTAEYHTGVKKTKLGLHTQQDGQTDRQSPSKEAEGYPKYDISSMKCKTYKSILYTV